MKNARRPRRNPLYRRALDGQLYSLTSRSTHAREQRDICSNVTGTHSPTRPSATAARASEARAARV